jgi:hypothetical protein
MFDDSRLESPTWVRALQAAVIGVVSGIVLNAILSMAVLKGEAIDGTKRNEPKTKACKKHAPTKDAGAPPINAPTIGGVRWAFSATS